MKTNETFADSKTGWNVRPERQTLEGVHSFDTALGGMHAETDLAAVVLPLLSALDWEGDLIHVAESLPHFADTLDLTDVLNVMANLGYQSRFFQASPADMDARLMPCLYLPDDGLAMVLIRAMGENVLVYDTVSSSYRTIPTPEGQGSIHIFHSMTDEDYARMAADTGGNYVKGTLRRFKSMFARILLVSAVSNLLVLATPLLIKSVYDFYLPSGSTVLLISLLIGCLIAVAGDFAMRSLRAKMIAYLSARIDFLLGLGVFRRLLMLPPAYTEQANSNAQIARLRDFEMVREFFAGPMATTLAEAPFVVIFLGAMALLGGPLVFVPMTAMLVFIAVALLLRSSVERRLRASTQAAAARQEFLIEALTSPRAIKEAGATEVWNQRFRDLSADAALKQHQANRINTMMAAGAQALVVITGISTLAYGVHLVLDGTMTVGSLMAAMIIVWWVLRPLQTFFSLSIQTNRVRGSAEQINRLMQLKPERMRAPTIQAVPDLKGKISLQNVSLRYTADTDPAVLGLNLDIEPGDIIGLIGENGSGKSTVLKLLMGLYRPQTGSILIDGIDIRQFDQIELRRQIAYVPQKPDLFFGTVAQNLRLASPNASDEELRWACKEADLLDEIMDLPDQFQTRMGDGRSDQFSSSFRQRLSLARAYLKRAPITLMDEPASSLDFLSDRQLMLALERMKGHTTVILVTHRPSHLKLVNKVAMMQQGQIRMFGPTQQVLNRLPPNFF